jgi:predicted ATPase/class 3 adenylate cyclase
VDIAAWLRELGLERYEEAFRENEIDAEILPKLTADDLKDLGVTTVGHRRKLLEAIAALAEPASAPQAEPSTPAVAAPNARPAEAERRQLTVLFCDLVGSTELAARLDPEDLREVMRAYQAACADVVGRFEGYVAMFLGDGVLAYFGWPRAHEDDAERAVRAGLQLVQDVARLEPRAGIRLQARVGVATGHVVVGDLISEGVSDRDAVSGDTPNLAARLQAVTAPGSVVISSSTRRLVGGLFELDDLGPQRLKGFAEPLSAWRVSGESPAEGRFEARHSAGLTPLVGREEEIALLLRRWEQAREGEGQVVLLSGEPGIGKSRIVRELRERIAEPHVRLTHQCSPYHQTSPLHPVVEHLERAAGFERDDPPEARLAKLDALLARGTDKLDQAVPLVAALLGIPTNDRYRLPELTPQRQKQLTLEALADQLEGLSAEQPVLLVYEDVHWIDPTTQELLGLAIERIQHLPVLAIVTLRPDFMPPWSKQPHVSVLALTRLGRRDGAAMVDRVVGNKALPAEVSAQIAAKTDGVPLFVEELTKAVLESGLLDDQGDHYELAGPLPPLAIPSTLHDSLLARLDRLGPVKEVAQTGACIGREFSHELLAAVASLGDNELRDAVTRLLESGLILRRGPPSAASYAFKHTLVQEAACGTLLRSKRQQQHARIARALEERFPETADTKPELLAHHCTQAGLTTKAVAYWRKAGQLSTARSAAAEAVAQLTQGLELLQQLPDDTERRWWELDLQVALGSALIAARGYAAPETAAAYARAYELCREAGAVRRLFPVLFGRYVTHLLGAKLAVAREAAAESLRLSERQDDDKATLVTSHRSVGTAAFALGDLSAARMHLEEALTLYDPERHRPLAFVYAQDVRVAGLSWLALALFVQGFPEQALQRSDEAVAAAPEVRHPNTTAQSLLCACVLSELVGRRQELQAHAEVLVALATEHGLPFWLAMGTIMQGWALADAGEAEAGIAQLRRGLVAWEDTGAALIVPYYLGLVAKALAKAGRAGEGLGALIEALDRVAGTEELWFKAELHRLRGELLLALPKPDQPEAEACFRKALAVAREQDARMWELRAATSLAQLWRDQGKRAEAHDLLAPVYGWFTEGFGTADLRDGKALLDELS